ncbi:hypothetical protein SNOG_03273 [Parastagonospora nodorum SN15]|uniref:Uncharacterized protein n=1 Tax=Phaeosphaeria nodorum (strain SN15 / ATCC MYA-4574 / FGSC 10173) TaxID=321614 RepID=Q0UY91_PHANO|nr:hypothetical protein SNOG_03273 [Parastagonospora nodorum SN15]EAT90004.1 hypothetical protein SNOG_03273 [Parastagonospora nodorum SN15]
MHHRDLTLRQILEKANPAPPPESLAMFLPGWGSRSPAEPRSGLAHDVVGLGPLVPLLRFALLFAELSGFSLSPLAGLVNLE